MRIDISLLFTAASVLALSSCTANETSAKVEPASTEVAKAATAEAKPAPKPEPVVRTVSVPSGTALSIRTDSTVSTRDTQSGETVHGTLAAPLSVGGRVIAPRGAEATLLVVDSDPGGRVKGRASIGLRLTSLRVGGETKDVVANTFWKEAPGTKKKDAIKVGIMSGIGAAVGAIADGGKGAAIGAGAGAGAGSGVVLATRGDAAVIPAESVLPFRLGQPVTVSVGN